jgi:hypothetical protein
MDGKNKQALSPVEIEDYLNQAEEFFLKGLPYLTDEESN